MTQKEKSPIIGNITDAFRILDTIAMHSNIGISALAQHLELPKTRVFRIIKSLEDVGAIRQNDDSSYGIGTHMLKYAQSIQISGNIIDIAEPHIKKAVALTGESINLGMAHGNDLLIIRRIHGEYYQLQTQLRPIGELYCSGMGKIFLAYREDSDLELYYRDLPKRTVNTVNSLQGFKQQQAQILKENLSMDLEEFEYGLSCYAVPIFDLEGKPQYALSVSGPSSRLEYKDLDRLIAVLKECAYAIQQEYQTQERFLKGE